MSGRSEHATSNLRYLGDMLGQLKSFSTANDDMFLTYLISMAHAEAASQLKEVRAKLPDETHRV